MEDDNHQQLMELQIEDANQNQDQDEINIVQASSSRNLMFSICVMPGTIMHIGIAIENRFPDGAWCISTLLIHNGQHYSHTIHNHAMNSELLRTLGSIHEPNAVNNPNNMLPQLLMPLDLPRDATLTIEGPIFPNLTRSQMYLAALDDIYMSFMQNRVRILNYLIDTNRYITLRLNHCSTALGDLETRVNRSTDDEDDDDHQDINSAFNSYNDRSLERYISNACRLFTDSDDDDELSSAVEADEDVDDADVHHDANETWSTTGTDYNLDTEWENRMSYPRHVGCPMFLCHRNWRSCNSCNSAGEPEDLWSDTTSSNSEDLNMWQYNEDHSFALTAFSRPFRRLTQELPPQTAQEEREIDQFLHDLCDFPSFNIFQGIEPQMEPLHSLGRWRTGGNTSSPNNIDCMNHEPLFSGNNGYWFPNPNPVCDCYSHKPEPETMLDSMESESEIDETSSDEQVVPLALYLQQTDELIAQIWATL